MRPGSFCTSVLRTRDVERAAKFYGELVGWTTQAVPGTADHRLLQFAGKTVASLQRITEGNDLWVPHVCVEDIDRSSVDAIALGATFLDSFDIPGIARSASLVDLEGATFGMWQAQPHQGAELIEEVGCLWWIEVLSNDIGGIFDSGGAVFVMRSPVAS